mmetsp:Transcript_6492/g.14975  ORF Transcript_6492/g.14975 Transcript_6492/m.14975 type:complete len:181 (-) Transcript_6492:41-583(-)|eukprot:CAMPEP_0206431946 /NCGR_PEP_ID=MMETSP0324_2-20121206/7641_1 /ASSEMBLY_ACC=CAM_ASM_000836 /TAXON_ID=2866 /ORGANISM="Crypthecodinium cohnii, Strain Seligo" /LENGTH=180 /DNA_ID=CAMNT_0053897919 /DNA_START=337 /DNA_END=879 /DNA_ORIENTATION=-
MDSTALATNTIAFPEKMPLTTRSKNAARCEAQSLRRCHRGRRANRYNRLRIYPNSGLSVTESNDQEACVPTCNDEDADVEDAEISAKSKHKNQRSVHFSAEPDEIIEVQPYAEVYGLHPSEFVFDKDYYMVPTGGHHGFLDVLAAMETVKSLEVDENAPDYDSDTDDDEPWTYECEIQFV